MQNLRNANANCRFAVESIGSGKLTKRVDRRFGGDPRSALCNGENHIPKYLPYIVLTDVCPTAETERTTNARSSRGISTPTARRDVPSKFAGSGFGVIDFPHRIAGAQR